MGVQGEMGGMTVSEWRVGGGGRGVGQVSRFYTLDTHHNRTEQEWILGFYFKVT